MPDAALQPSDDAWAPVRQVLSQFPFITLAVVFGSMASGQAHADSDLDLAVAAQRPLTPAEKLAITGALAELTGRPIDLIDLANAPEPVLGQVVRHGKRLLGSADQFAELINRHLVAQADFVPYMNRILAERRMAWIGK